MAIIFLIFKKYLLMLAIFVCEYLGILKNKKKTKESEKLIQKHLFKVKLKKIMIKLKIKYKFKKFRENKC